MIEIRNRLLYINNSPFVVRGGELQNSSMSSAAHMRPIWKSLSDSNLNTVLGAVTWEQIEPEEGNFDFKELDACIRDARAAGLKLVLLWFGAFKNGMSSYAPSWVKSNPHRFPRVVVKRPDGKLRFTEVLSILSGDETKDADSIAFAKLMSHIRRIDEKHCTVIMVQCENEVGLLSDSIDRSSMAEEQFQSAVPEDLLNFLREDWNSLHPLFKEKFSKPSVTSNGGNWEQVFGESPFTNELFMAYHYAKYVDHVALSGRKEYNIPIYTNVWQNQYGKQGAAAGGGKPGEYPSGGAIGGVLDIWMRFAPTLDFISPDIYVNDYDERCQWYSHKNQPLFIPEQRRDEYGARRMWRAIGEYKAIGACPFGIDSLEYDTWKKHYKLLKEVEPLLIDAYKNDHPMTGFFFDEFNSKAPADVIHHNFPKYRVTIERSRVFGVPDVGYGIIINYSPDSFVLVGTGFQVTLTAADNQLQAGIAKVQEIYFENENLRTLRWMNGDETQSGACIMMPSEKIDYGDFPVAISIPAGSKMAIAHAYTIPSYEG
ncbi:beta-galactosidase [Sugiyamaella lignohabitans]|uniref:Beta-galactosidase n=1 Tax=Sugiyamaella lignohabitans TaxID=796027 RepID=A0A167CJ00_9ASCO|nr:beta-galactosidase [Sugiyamaella lignohabitans]ANB11762.1 beta-galactosidase [Sugiyamaella lignohabitans]